MAKTIQPSTFVIFGGTGDLSRRKLLPALCRLEEDGRLHKQFKIVALGRRERDTADLRNTLREFLEKAGLLSTAMESILGRLFYHSMGKGTDGDYNSLAARLDELEKQDSGPSNRTYYLSLPPRVFLPTVQGLGRAGLNKSQGWTRLVVEKPFGHDLETAVELNRSIHEWFTEEQIYRIDHYLGKETVQNLLVFRLANALIESSWNRDRVESVQITVGESLGVGTRAEYYDHAGALRDMVQNHLTQLLTLVAMDVPSSFSADAIRSEKIKVLRSLRPFPEDISESVVRGQYSKSETAGKGYLEEEGVPANSTTETFVALCMYVDSWRWQGVPFYLRTGKRMLQKSTQIAIRFRNAPVSFFPEKNGAQDTNDVLTITLQPHEGFSFYFDIKSPGPGMKLKRIPLRFDYDSEFGEKMPDAYQTLLLDVLEGDQTLFVHADEVEESWRVYAPLLENPPPVYPYTSGTWGPKEADFLSIPEKDIWQRENV